MDQEVIRLIARELQLEPTEICQTSSDCLPYIYTQDSLSKIAAVLHRLKPYLQAKPEKDAEKSVATHDRVQKMNRNRS